MDGRSKAKTTLSTPIHYIHWLANRLCKYFNEWVNGMRTCNVIEPLVSGLQLKRRLMRKIMIVLNRKKVKKLNLLQIVKKTRRKSAMDTKRMTASKVSQEKLLGSLVMFLSDARQPEVVFFSVLDNVFGQMFGQIVSMIVKTLRNTNFAASSCFKMKKTSLPVSVRRSKTPLFKLSIVPYKYVRRIFLTASLLSGRIHEAIS